MLPGRRNTRGPKDEKQVGMEKGEANLGLAHGRRRWQCEPVTERQCYVDPADGFRTRRCVQGVCPGRGAKRAIACALQPIQAKARLAYVPWLKAFGHRRGPRTRSEATLHLENRPPSVLHFGTIAHHEPGSRAFAGGQLEVILPSSIRPVRPSASAS